MAIAKMAEPHRGLRTLFRAEACAEWLIKETGMSLEQAQATIADIKSLGIRIADHLNEIAANPCWMLGYAAANFSQPAVLVYGTGGMDPMGIKAAHRYMKAAAERCCVINISPSCPPAAKCVELECD